MTAKIIELKNTRMSTIRCQESGTAFPQLYRVTGVFFKLKEGTVQRASCLIDNPEDVVPGDEPAGPAYTLDPTNPQGFANPTWVPIRQLDRNLDDGWVIVRHHANNDCLEAYLDGLQDYEREWRTGDTWVFRSEFGIFTVIHRSPTSGRPNHVVGYYTKVADPLHPGGVMNWCKAIDADGNEHNEDIFLPDDFPDPIGAVRELGEVE